MLNDALGQHGIGDLLEAGNVGTGDIVACHAEFLGGGIQIVEDVHHDLLKLAVYLLKAPA